MAGLGGWGPAAAAAPGVKKQPRMVSVHWAKTKGGKHASAKIGEHKGKRAYRQSTEVADLGRGRLDLAVKRWRRRSEPRDANLQNRGRRGW